MLNWFYLHSMGRLEDTVTGASGYSYIRETLESIQGQIIRSQAHSWFWYIKRERDHIAQGEIHTQERLRYKTQLSSSVSGLTNLVLVYFLSLINKGVGFLPVDVGL